MRTPRILLFMAMSLNGLIARPDGSEDFLSHENWLSFCKMVAKTGNFIAGRRSYELVNQWPQYNFNSVEARLKLIVSRNEDLAFSAPYKRVNSPTEGVRALKDAGFEEGLLVGGSALNTSFLREGLVDEVRINVEPVMIAQGLPFLSLCNLDVPLTLEEVAKTPSGIVELRYSCRGVR